MQQFNKISTYSNVIKHLLANTYLPLMRSVREGDYICADRIYILKCEVIKCTSSGYIGKKGFLSNTPLANWVNLGEYHFGEKDGKLSTKYVSNAEGYDYKTHERLGQYLRNLRDMYGLNLMPLYNCFSNQFLENHVIKNNTILKTSQDNNTKIYKIPIRFNQDYTVCIENPGVTTFAPAFIRYNSLVKQNNTIYGNGLDVTNQYINLHSATNIYSEGNLSFGKPYKIRFDNKPEHKQLIKYNTEYRNEYLEIVINLKYIPHENLEEFEDGVDYYVYEYDSETESYKYNKVDTETTLEPDPEETYYTYEPYFEHAITYYILNENNEFEEVDTSQPPQVDLTYYTHRRIIDKDKVYFHDITDEICTQYNDIEDTLYLLIQVPKAFNQNIVVLEGDYTELNSQKIVDGLFRNKLPDFLYDKFYTHDLNLMTMTSTEPRPFSPVLIEFLLWNAISTLDTINNDFDRLSQQLSLLNIPYTDDIYYTYPNYWVPRYRQIISDYINAHSTNSIQDNIGYVTRNIEEYIIKSIDSNNAIFGG